MVKGTYHLFELEIGGLAFANLRFAEFFEFEKGHGTFSSPIL